MRSFYRVMLVLLLSGCVSSPNFILSDDKAVLEQQLIDTMKRLSPSRKQELLSALHTIQLNNSDLMSSNFDDKRLRLDFALLADVLGGKEYSQISEISSSGTMQIKFQ